MMRRILELPLLVVLSGAGSLAMLLPAAHAAVYANFAVARPFFYGAIMFFLFTMLVGIATANYRPRIAARSQLVALLGKADLDASISRERLIMMQGQCLQVTQLSDGERECVVGAKVADARSWIEHGARGIRQALRLQPGVRLGWQGQLF